VMPALSGALLRDHRFAHHNAGTHRIPHPEQNNASLGAFRLQFSEPF
jgi:hypothetical protein